MREMVEIFPAKLRKLWNDLELRILVLLSLFLQIVLISTGNRRKYTRRKWVAVILWLSYLSADAVATISLGVLSQTQGDAESLIDPSYTIMAFWAPFLLIHLGGPDTITAYSLADNELWPRHLLALVGQVGVAIYIFLRSWTGTPINYLWIVVFVAGLVKYGERTWVLFLASKDQFPESMISASDPGERNLIIDKLNGKAIESSSVQDGIVLQYAYSLFGTFKKLFADFTLSGGDMETSSGFFMHNDTTWDQAFTIVEVELGLIYDWFYSKAFILYSPHGFFLRMLSFSTTTAASVAFLIIDKNVYPKTEVIITYILLASAIFLEIYAIMILLSSDRMMIWLSGDWNTLPQLITKFKNPIVFTISKTVPLLQYLHIVPARMRWSNAMGQYNVLINCCLESKPMCSKVRQYLEKYLFWNGVSVPKGLKALIIYELKERVHTHHDGNHFGSYRGDNILLKELNYFRSYDKKRAEFDESVLLWHLATDFCYHTDVDEEEEPDKTWLYEFIINEESTLENNLRFKREICRLLSNYMMHLLITSPFILPIGIGIGKIQLQHTCAEATEFFAEQKSIKLYARQIFHQADTGWTRSEKAWRSLLFDACRLAKSLQSLEVGQKWEKITDAWLHILAFAAVQCKSNDHAEKLSHGGELLTHVWLLMAHLGLSAAFEF